MKKKFNNKNYSKNEEKFNLQPLDNGKIIKSHNLNSDPIMTKNNNIMNNNSTKLKSNVVHFANFYNTNFQYAIYF